MAILAYSIYDREYIKNINLFNTNKKETLILDGIYLFSEVMGVAETTNILDPNYFNFTTFFDLSIYLQNGYIDVMIESPIVTSNIDFFTGNPLNKFFLSLIIIDEDDEPTNDSSLAPSVEYKNYGSLGMPIRTPLG